MSAHVGVAGRGRTHPQAEKGVAIQSLERGLRLLASFRRSPTLSLSDLAELLPIHKSSTLRLVGTLESLGYVAREPLTGRYRLGPTVYELGGLALLRLDVRTAARPAIEQLVAETRETALLAIRDRAEAIVVDGVESPQQLKAGVDLGHRLPLHATACGKCLLAALPEAEVQRLVLSGPLARFTPATMVDPNRFLEELRQVRAQGYAVNRQENRVTGAHWVGSAIFGPTGEVLAALVVGAPVDRLPLEALDSMGERVRDIARTVSQQLGAPVPTEASTAGDREER